MDYLDSRIHIFKYYKLILQKQKKKILNLVCFFQNSLDAWVHLSPSRIWSRGMNWSREICEFVSNLNNLGWEIRNQIGLHKTKPWPAKFNKVHGLSRRISDFTYQKCLWISFEGVSVMLVLNIFKKLFY